MMRICCLDLWLWKLSLGLPHVLLLWRPTIKPATIITSLWGLLPLLSLHEIKVVWNLSLAEGDSRSAGIRAMWDDSQDLSRRKTSGTAQALSFAMFSSFYLLFWVVMGFFCSKTPCDMLIHNISAWLRELNSDAQWFLSANTLKKEWKSSLVINSGLRTLSFTCKSCLFLCSLRNSIIAYERSYCFNIRFASLSLLPGMTRPTQDPHWWPWVKGLAHRAITNIN